MKFDLNALFPTIDSEEFFKSYQENRPLVCHNSAVLNRISDLNFLKSIESLIEHWPSEVNVYDKSLADEVSSFKTDPKTAFKIFKNQKQGLFFDEPNLFDPTIAHALKQISHDFGFSKLTLGRSLLYVIAKEQGTSAHFDQNINIVIQIKGHKKWWISQNNEVENPLERFTIGSPAERELSSYAHKIPSKMPQTNIQEFTLAPGSVLFLPRGAWHETLALEDALSLNFTYTVPSWADLMCTSLRAHLIQSKQWRETAHYVGDPSRAHVSIEQFEELICELAQQFQELSAFQILSSTES